MTDTLPLLFWPSTLLVVIALLLWKPASQRRGRFWVLPTFFALAACVFATLTYLNHSRSWGQILAWSCALLSLVTAWTATLFMSQKRTVTHEVAKVSSLISVLHLIGLLTAVVAVIIQVYVLGVRAIACLIDIVSSVPRATENSYGFSAAGLWSLVFILLAILCAERSTHVHVLRTWALIIIVMIVTWFSLLWRPIELSAQSGLVRNQGPVILVGLLGVLSLCAVVLQGSMGLRSRWRSALSSPDDLAISSISWSGYREVCGGIIVITLLLLSHHLIVPLSLTGDHKVVVVIVLTFSACAAGYASLILTMRKWHPNFADAGLGILSLGICSVMFILLPARHSRLTDYYPIIFNILMVGFGIGTWLWTWLSLVWEQQLDNNVAWTTEGLLIRHTKRMAFLCAVLAMTSGGMMAIWPYLRIVGTGDASLGRIASGLSGNLFLLLIFLWTARRLRRHTFHMLTILALVSTTGFMLLRMLPFSEHAR